MSLLRPAKEGVSPERLCRRQGFVAIRWFLAEQVAEEEVLQTPLAISATRSMPAAGDDQQIEVFPGFDERIGKTHRRFRWHVVVQLAHDEE